MSHLMQTRCELCPKNLQPSSFLSNASEKYLLREQSWKFSPVALIVSSAVCSRREPLTKLKTAVTEYICHTSAVTVEQGNRNSMKIVTACNIFAPSQQVIHDRRWNHDFRMPEKQGRRRVFGHHRESTASLSLMFQDAEFSKNYSALAILIHRLFVRRICLIIEGTVPLVVSAGGC